MPVAQSLIWAQSRKSPSSARMAETTARSGKLIGSCLQAGDPVLAEQGVVVAHHPGHRDDGAAQCHELRQGGFAHRGQDQADLVGCGVDCARSWIVIVGLSRYDVAVG